MASEKILVGKAKPPHKVHILSWVLSLDKDGYIPCHYKNCSFMAMSLDEMVAHFHYSGCRNNYPFRCTHCNLSTDLKEKLLFHKIYVHSYRAATEEQKELSDLLRIKKDISSNLRRGWNEFLKYKGYIKCLNQACCFIVDSLEEIEDHYLNTCKEDFWRSLQVKCGVCHGRFQTIESMEEHILKAHSSVKDHVLKFKTEHHQVDLLISEWVKNILASKQARCPVPGCRFVDNNAKILEKHYKQCNGEPKGYKICPLCNSWVLNDEKLVDHTRCIHKEIDKQVTTSQTSCKQEVVEHNVCGLLNNNAGSGDKTNDEIEILAPVNKRYTSVIKPMGNRNSTQMHSLNHGEKCFSTPVKPQSVSRSKSIDCVDSDLSNVQYSTENLINGLPVEDIPFTFMGGEQNNDMKKKCFKSKEKSVCQKILQKSSVANHDKISKPLPTCIEEVATMIKDQTNGSPIPIEIKIDKTEFTVTVDILDKNMSKQQSFPKDIDSLNRALREESLKFLESVSMKTTPRCDVKRVFDPYSKQMFPLKLSVRKNQQCENNEISTVNAKHKPRDETKEQMPNSVKESAEPIVYLEETPTTNKNVSFKECSDHSSSSNCNLLKKSSCDSIGVDGSSDVSNLAEETNDSLNQVHESAAKSLHPLGMSGETVDRMDNVLCTTDILAQETLDPLDMNTGVESDKDGFLVRSNVHSKVTLDGITNEKDKFLDKPNSSVEVMLNPLDSGKEAANRKSEFLNRDDTTAAKTFDLADMPEAMDNQTNSSVLNEQNDSSGGSGIITEDSSDGSLYMSDDEVDNSFLTSRSASEKANASFHESNDIAVDSLIISRTTLDGAKQSLNKPDGAIIDSLHPLRTTADTANFPVSISGNGVNNSLNTSKDISNERNVAFEISQIVKEENIPDLKESEINYIKPYLKTLPKGLVSTSQSSERYLSEKYILPDIMDPATDDSNDGPQEAEQSFLPCDYVLQDDQQLLANTRVNELSLVTEKGNEVSKEYSTKTKPVEPINSAPEDLDSSGYPFLGFTSDDLKCSYIKYLKCYDKYKSKSTPNIPLEIESSELSEKSFKGRISSYNSPIACSTPSVSKNERWVTSARRITKAKSFCGITFTESQTNSGQETQNNVEFLLKIKESDTKKISPCSVSEAHIDCSLISNCKEDQSRCHPNFIDTNEMSDKMRDKHSVKERDFTEIPITKNFNSGLKSVPKVSPNKLYPNKNCDHEKSFSEIDLPLKRKRGRPRKSNLCKTSFCEDNDKVKNGKMSDFNELSVDTDINKKKIDNSVTNVRNEMESKKRLVSRPSWFDEFVLNSSKGIAKDKHLSSEITIKKERVRPEKNELDNNYLLKSDVLESNRKDSLLNSIHSESETSYSGLILKKKRGRPSKKVVNNTASEQTKESSISEEPRDVSTSEHDNSLFQNGNCNKIVKEETIDLFHKAKKNCERSNNFSNENNKKCDVLLSDDSLKKKRGRPRKIYRSNEETSVLSSLKNSQKSEKPLTDQAFANRDNSESPSELLGVKEKIHKTFNYLSNTSDIQPNTPGFFLKKKRGRPKRSIQSNTTASETSLLIVSNNSEGIDNNSLAKYSKHETQTTVEQCESLIVKSPNQVISVIDAKNVQSADIDRNSVKYQSSSGYKDSPFQETCLKRKRGRPKRSMFVNSSFSTPLLSPTEISKETGNSLVNNSVLKNTGSSRIKYCKSDYNMTSELHSEILENSSQKLCSPSNCSGVKADPSYSEPFLKKKRGRPKKNINNTAEPSLSLLPKNVQEVDNTLVKRFLNNESPSIIEKCESHCDETPITLPGFNDNSNKSCSSSNNNCLASDTSITASPLKKKRGRTKKFKPNFNSTLETSQVLSPMNSQNDDFDSEPPLKKMRRSINSSSTSERPFVSSAINDHHAEDEMVSLIYTESPIIKSDFENLRLKSYEKSPEESPCSLSQNHTDVDEFFTESPYTNADILENQSAAKRGKQRRHNGRIESFTKLDEPNKMVKCAICEKSMTAVTYQKKHLPKHNFIAWLVGEEPLPLHDMSSMVTILNRGKKPYPRFLFKCETCQEKRKSAKGFLIHKATCGRTDMKFESSDDVTREVVEDVTPEDLENVTCPEAVDVNFESTQNVSVSNVRGNINYYTPKKKTRKIPDWKSEMRSKGSGNIETFFSESSVENLIKGNNSAAHLSVRALKMRSLNERITASSKIQEPNKEVTCAICKETLTAIQYQKTHLLKHNFIAWLEGEEPLPVDDINSMVNVLNRGKAKFPRFVFTCDVCKEGKRSALGFLSHRKFCGTSEEEKHKMLISCIYCGRVMMPLSLPAHMYQYHRVETSVNDDILLEPESTRKAAAKCLGKIADYAVDAVDGLEKIKEINDDNYMDETIFGEEMRKEERGRSHRFYSRTDKRPSKNLKIFWKKNEDRGEPLKCNFPQCEFICSTIEEMKLHFKTCKFDPPSFSCTNCYHMNKSEEDMKEHVRHCYRSYEPLDYSSGDESNERTILPYLKIVESDLTYKPKLHFFRPAVDWTKLAYETEFSQETVFPEFGISPDCWDPLPKCNTELFQPDTNISMPVNCNDSSWIEMNSFEGKCFEGKNVGVGFTGGPIWGLAWCPSKGEQYIATCPQNSMETDFQVGSTYNGPGLIQIWTIGNVNNSANSNLQSLDFVYGICHEERGCWQLAWCPGGGETESRLGLLALATTSGVIPIFAVPKPHILPINETKFYRLKAIKNLELPSNEKWQCSAISWSKKKPHQTIVAGFVNGVIGVWDLNCCSSLLRTSSGSLLPYKIFEAHNSFITGVCLSPVNDNSLVSASFDNSLKVWDLRDTSAPLSISKRGLPTSIDWLRHWMMTTSAYDIAYALSHNNVCLQALRGIMSQSLHLSSGIHSTAWSVAANDWLNAVAASFDNGQVTVSFALKHIVNNHKDKKKFTKVVLQSTLQELPNTRPSKGKNLTPSDISSTLYKESSGKYGLQIKTDFKVHSFGANDELKENTTESELDIYPLNSVNKVAWSPNGQSFSYLAMGYQSGFLVISKLSFPFNDQMVIDSVLPKE